MSEPTLSLVVIARGPALALARLLRSVARADGAGQVELLLGLNGGRGKPFTERLARRYLGDRVTVLALERTNLGSARNLLARRARSQVVVFLDDDVEIPVGFLMSVRRTFAKSGTIVAGGPNLTPPRGTRFEQLVGRVLASVVATGPVRRRYRGGKARANERTLTLCNLAVQKDVFCSLEFDDRLRGGEENDLLRRLANRAGTFVWSSDLAVHHHRRATFVQHFRQMVKYGFGRGQVVVGAPAVGQAVFLAPATAAAAFAVAALSAPAVVVPALVGYCGLVLAAAACAATGPPSIAAAYALIVATHVGYAAGTVAGCVYELTARLRPPLPAPSLAAGETDGA